MRDLITPGQTMTRRHVIAAAKTIVLSLGPDTILELGESAVQSYYPDNCAEITAEAIIQANRVYAFLGYERLH